MKRGRVTAAYPDEQPASHEGFSSSLKKHLMFLADATSKNSDRPLTLHYNVQNST